MLWPEDGLLLERKYKCLRYANQSYNSMVSENVGPFSSYFFINYILHDGNHKKVIKKTSDCYFILYRYKRKSSIMTKKKPSVINTKQHLPMKTRKKQYYHDCK